MNISYNWLKNYLNIDLPAEKLSTILTDIGLEVGSVEKIQTIKGGLEGLVVGEVLTCQDHQNSDHLHITTVNIGAEEPLKIVCGAPNIDAGQKVVVATVGTTLYSGDETFTIKKSKIRGEESFGMICSEVEIGVGNDNSGIMVLPADTPAGTLAKDYFNIQDDTLFEVDITPNRADAISHIGIARDIAAYGALYDNSITLKKPTVDNFKVENNDLTIPVIVENTEACPRYSAVTISNVKVKESPDWLKNNLLAIGLKPINNVVDVTNFVQHELGQPLHAFDANVITSKTVRVKNLAEGTVFKTLDGVERKLSANDLMICNDNEPMCIAGVFGGEVSGVTEKSTHVFLESAYFNPVNVRKTARFHGLNTDASFRFERGCDPNITIFALKRAALLIQEVAGGTISSEIIDEYPNPIEDFNVTLNKKKIDSIIGKEIGRENIVKILQGLEMTIVSETDEAFELKVPPYRVDVQRDVDVIEDILRIYGYNNVEISENLISTLSFVKKPDNHKLQTLISEQLTAQGFNEILNNSLTKISYYTDSKTYPEANCVKMMNPLSSDLSVLRQTLLFGGLESVVRNSNYKQTDLKFYEFGKCYQYFADKKSETKPLTAYSENYHLGIWITGKNNSGSWNLKETETSFYELKAHVENILKRLGVNSKRIVVNEFGNELFEQGLEISLKNGPLLVQEGIVNRKLAKKMDLASELFFAEIYWDNILKTLSTKDVSINDISKFPSVNRDLAFLLDKDVEFADIERIAFETERKLLKSVKLFDVYEGKNLEAGKKSYAINFTLQDENKTMTDKVIDTVMNKIQQNIEKKLDAKLRG